MASYRKAVLILSTAGAPQVYLGDNDDDTENIFKAMIVDHDAVETTAFFVFTDTARNEMRTINAQVVDGREVAFVVRRDSGTLSIFLFADPVSAMRFARSFGQGGLACVEVAQNRAGSSRLSHVVPVRSRSTRPPDKDFCWLNPDTELPIPDIRPLRAPVGMCLRCIARPLGDDAASRLLGLCPHCRSALARLAEWRANEGRV